MRQVSKDEFFAAMNPRNVHPRVDQSTLKGRYHVSHWEDQETRTVIGKAVSDSHGVAETEFYLGG